MQPDDRLLVDGQETARITSLSLRTIERLVSMGRCMVLTEGEAAPVSAAQHVEDTNGGNRTLIEAIAKGHHWQAQLESGEYASLEDLAHAVGCDRTYVGRILRLTNLAPDTIEAILRGDEPDGLPRRIRQAETGLSLEKLRKNLPVRWEEQRKSLSLKAAPPAA